MNLFLRKLLSSHLARREATCRPVRLLALLVAGLAVALAPLRVRGLPPEISGLVAQNQHSTINAHPLASYLYPEPFLPTKVTEDDFAISYFKSFVPDKTPREENYAGDPSLSFGEDLAPTASAAPLVSQRRVFGIGFEEQPETLPSIGLSLETIPDAPAQQSGKITRSMPPAVVEAVGVLLRKAPADSINAYSAAEEQEATGRAVAKAAAQLLKQSEVPKNLPEKIPTPDLAPAAPPSAPAAAGPAPETTSCPTCLREFYFGRPIHRLKEARDSIGGCSTCGGGWRCSPGHEPCEPCEAHNGPLGRLFCDFYECLCCPDPCYEPTWRQIPNAALFVDGARPVTQTEVRWNSSKGGIFPDRSEYIWARADGKGRGPRPPNGALAEFHFDYDDLVLVTETAKDKLSAIIVMPYRAVAPETFASGAGFGDMSIGTKTLLFDCELLQVSMQMMTYLPLGNSLKGVGTGHVSLEPSLLFALKLTCDTYIQGQLSEWIPLGGDPSYMGSIFHTHSSINHVIHRFGPAIPVVGTMEFNTYSFQDGSYTDPIRGAFQKASDTTYVSLGPGVRLFFCDKLDIGFGTAFAVTGDHFSREYYRTSVRFRF